MARSTRQSRSVRTGRAPRQVRLDRRAGRTRSSSHALAAAWRSTVDRSLSPRRTAATRLRPAACRPPAWSARGGCLEFGPRGPPATCQPSSAPTQPDSERRGPASRCRQASAARSRSSRRERAAGWLPRFASALHRDAPAPVNLTPNRGPRTASAPAAGGRTPRAARGARGGARTQPRRTDGMTDDEGDNRPAHRGRQRCRPPPQSRSVTANTAFNDDLAPSLPPASSIAEPVRPRYSPDATVAGGRPAGQPWSPPPDAGSCPMIPAARGGW